MNLQNFAERVLILRRLLALTLFSTATLVIGNIVVLGLPQAREVLFSLDDHDGASWRLFGWLVFAHLYWATTAWFVARLLIGRRFPIEFVEVPHVNPSGPDKHDSFTEFCARWIPRVLGLLATLPFSITMIGVHPLFGSILTALGLAFLAFVWSRRYFDKLIKNKQLPGLVDEPIVKIGHATRRGVHYAYFDTLGSKGTCTLLILFLISFLTLGLLWAYPIGFGRCVGAPALLLIALGSWTLMGGMVLSYLPRTRNLPTLNWVPLVLFLVAAGVDNHPVARPANAGLGSKLSDWRADRPGMNEQFTKWMGRHTPGEPVYMVVIAGGASRAAYWGAVAMAQVEDAARLINGQKDKRRFASNIFMISGISGGSLGAAAFVTALAATPPEQATLTTTLETYLGKDFLSPTLGMMLYPDLVQRFIPAALPRTDRSYALERAWIDDWKVAGLATAADWWSDNLTAPYRAAPDRNLPSMVLNTVRLEDGRRILQSNLKFELPDAFDLLANGFETCDLTLAGAVHNSARFPYVSPAGQVRVTRSKKEAEQGESAQGCPPAEQGRKPWVWGHLGDGGYHEVSGAATLADVIETLRDKGLLLKTDQGLMACNFEKKCVSPVVIVVLDNAPVTEGPAWRRTADGKPREIDQQQLANSFPLSEITSPPLGLVYGWQSNSERAERRLQRLAGPAPEHYVELRFPLHPGVRRPSMNWVLDQESRWLLKSESVHARALINLSAMPPAEGTCPKVQNHSAFWQPDKRFWKLDFESWKCGVPHNPTEAALLANLQRLYKLVLVKQP